MPPTRVGVVGGGQLGRMLALAAPPLGITVRCLVRNTRAPAAAVGPVLVGDPADPADLRAFAATADVVTYETEDLRAEPLEGLSVPVRPGLASLRQGQDRWAEKQLFAACGVPAAPTRPASTPEQLRAALVELPRLVKTRTGGYDGRGQVLVRTAADTDAALALLDVPGPGVVVEELVRYDAEVSVVAARGLDGAFAAYPVVHNTHRDGVLRVSRVPAPGAAALQGPAEAAARAVADRLGHVGVLALELFVVGAELVANEIAPRVHNSGHWTIEGAETSQFEQHLRAVTGLPLGSAAARGPAAMVNLLGALPDRAAVLAVPGAHLHLYGKTPRPGRKVGHVTVTAADQGQLDDRLAELTSAVGNVTATSR